VAGQFRRDCLGNRPFRYRFACVAVPGGDRVAIKVNVADASASVVVDCPAVRIEYLVEAVTGPVEQVMMTGVVGVDPA
jgi:hypothetical protein